MQKNKTIKKTHFPKIINHQSLKSMGLGEESSSGGGPTVQAAARGCQELWPAEVTHSGSIQGLCSHFTTGTLGSSCNAKVQPGEDQSGSDQVCTLRVELNYRSAVGEYVGITYKETCSQKILQELTCIISLNKIFCKH